MSIKVGKMNESQMNESAKISKMTKQYGQAYSGVWQLPSGDPGLVATTDDIELVVIGDQDGIQIILTDEDDEMHTKDYSTNDEKKAVAEFKKIAGSLSDLVSGAKLAKKFGLEGM